MLEDEADLSAFVRAVDAPVNTLLRSSGPTLERLRAIGVRRASTGPGLWRSSQAALRERLARLAAQSSRAPD